MNYNLIQNTTKQDYDFIDDFEKIIREWTSPKIVAISIIVAVGYLFANIYLKKLSMGNDLIVFEIFILLAISVLILEFMVRSMIIFFGKQDKYNQLINSIDTAIIRFQNNANHFRDVKPDD
jgi:hypothetical protein